MKALFTALIITLPFCLFGQDLAGTYTTTMKMDDGQKVAMTIEIMENGNFSVDNNGDGQMDVYAKYTLEDDVVTIWTVSGDDCRDKGSYHIEIDEKSFKVKVRNDPCSGRIPPGGEATWKRKS